MVRQGVCKMKTKYNIGDALYTWKDYKVCKFKVIDIKIEKEIYYSGNDIYNLKEAFCSKNKKELLDKLLLQYIKLKKIIENTSFSKLKISRKKTPF